MEGEKQGQAGRRVREQVRRGNEWEGLKWGSRLFCKWRWYEVIKANHTLGSMWVRREEMLVCATQSAQEWQKFMEKDWMIQTCSLSFHCCNSKIFRYACLDEAKPRFIFKAEIYWNAISIKELGSNWCSANFLVIETIFVLLCGPWRNWNRNFKNQSLWQERSCCYTCICDSHQLSKIKEILGNVWN